MFTQIIERTDIAAVDVKDMLAFLNETNPNQKKFVDQLISYATGQIEGVTGLAIRPTRVRKFFDWVEITRTLPLVPAPISDLHLAKAYSIDNTPVDLDISEWQWTVGDNKIFLPDDFRAVNPRRSNTLMIEYSAELSPITEDIIMAIQQLVTHHYDNRGITNEVPERIRNLIFYPNNPVI